MLLELITGKRPVDLTNAMEDSLVDWVSIIATLTFLLTVKHYQENKKKNIDFYFFFSPLIGKISNI